MKCVRRALARSRGEIRFVGLAGFVLLLVTAVVGSLGFGQQVREPRQTLPPRHPMMLLVDLEEVPIEIQTDLGSAQTTISGQIRVTTLGNGPASVVPAEIDGGLLYIEPVPTS